MAEIVKSIGTTGRDFSTMVLWEADLGGAAGGAGNDAVGEAFKDSDFTADLIINDATPDSVKLTVPVSERHDGTAGTGVLITVTNVQGITNSRTSTIEWLELTRTSGFALGLRNTSLSDNSIIRNNIIHGMANTGIGAVGGITVSTAADGCDIINNFVYDLEHDNGTSNDCNGIQSSSRADILNNTVHNIQSNNAADNGDATCIRFPDSTNTIIKNNIATDPSGTTTGTKECYNPSAPVTADVDFNLASDTTASGANSLNSKTSANQFVSTVEGSEDLHLKAGADAIDEGDDLGTTNGRNFDIDNDDRDALGVIWDMGADEFIAVAVGVQRLTGSPSQISLSSPSSSPELVPVKFGSPL